MIDPLPRRTCRIFELWNYLLLLCSINCSNGLKLTDSMWLDHYDDNIRIAWEDAQRSMVRYSCAGVSHFYPVVILESRHQILLGAKNSLLRLQAGDLTELERVDWSPQVKEREMCRMKGQTQDACHNFIRLLVVHGDKMLACGTNAFAPSCTWRKAMDLSYVAESAHSGIGYVPYSPAFNNTYLMTSDGQLYTGVATDFSGSDPAILRITPRDLLLRTAKSNERWLYEPSFVASFEVGNFIYVFFREPAIELRPCSQFRVVSRVARICKNDVGGATILRDYWTTFAKARLNCSSSGGSQPGAPLFYYDNMQSVDYDPDENRFYAVFTTQEGGVAGSAICAFELDAIKAAFRGPFYSPTQPHWWASRDNSFPDFNCQTKSGSQASERSLQEAQGNQLMLKSVQSANHKPFITQEFEVFTHIRVAKVTAKQHGRLTILVVLTQQGWMSKFMVPPASPRSNPAGALVACLVEVVPLEDLGNHRAVLPDNGILTLQLYPKLNAAYIGRKQELVKLSLERCSRFKTKQQCLDSQDPYCGWNSRIKACSPPPGQITSHYYWHQNIQGCPKLNFPVDGMWNEWTAWFVCPQTGASGEQCQCRSRACDRPRPARGGRFCSGPNVQVSNCTVHGSWSPWGDWSSCSATCGIAVRSRRRHCSNPEPAYGGRLCLGPDIQQEYCTDVACPMPKVVPVDGDWSKWGLWGQCSRKCGGGIRKRVRHCDQPKPAYNGHPCPGCPEQFDTCQMDPCPTADHWFPWTVWTVTNRSGASTPNLWTMGRFKFGCSYETDGAQLDGVASEASDVTLSQSEQRICDKPDAGRCLAQFNNRKMTDVDSKKEEVDSGLALSHAGSFAAPSGKWSSWAQCTKSCGNGTQTRVKRYRSHGPTSCMGTDRERRYCNAVACEPEWSCWSEYGPCSVSCGLGVRHRVRECTNYPPGGDSPTAPLGCTNQDRVESAECIMPPCIYSDGFGDWSEWSSCSALSAQVRLRPCLSMEHCRGVPDAQMQRCIGTSEHGIDGPPISLAPSSSSTAAGASMINSNLIVGVLAGIVFGAGLGALILFIIARRQAASGRGGGCCYFASPNPAFDNSLNKNQYITNHPPTPTPTKCNIYTPPPISRNIHPMPNITPNPLSSMLTDDNPSLMSGNKPPPLPLSNNVSSTLRRNGTLRLHSPRITSSAASGNHDYEETDGLTEQETSLTLKRTMKTSLRPKDYL